MLSRNKSYSHQGGDGGEEAAETRVSIGGRRVRHHPLEGLLVLLHHKEQATSVVIKAKMMMTCKFVSQARHLPKGLPELDFLERCFLCGRELSPCEDVYMYRGEQGFCSKECRSRQILADERREGERAARERSKMPHRRRVIGRIHGSDRNERILALT